MKRILLSFIALVFIANSIYSQKLTDELPVDKNVIIGQLDNGLTYYIRENHKPENRANMQLLTKAGSMHEDEKQLGLAHFLEHMAFNGTKHFPENEVIKFMESAGMQFGSDINANTMFTRTYYLLEVPTDNGEMFDTGFEVLKDWLANISLKDEDIDKERKIIIEEWRRSKGAGERMQNKSIENLLFGTEYPNRLPIGDTAVILNAPREDFVRFYKDWYRTDNSALIFVGDFKKEEVESKIKKYFSALKKQKNPRKDPDLSIPLHKDIKTTVQSDKEFPAVIFSIMHKHEAVKNLNTYGAYKKSIERRLISAMLNARIAEKTTMGNPSFIAGGVGYGQLGGFARIDAASLGGRMKLDRLNDGIKDLLSEIFRAKQHGFKEGEFKRAKKQIKTQIETSFNNRETTHSNAFASEYYRNFMFGETIPGIAVEKEITEKYLNEISLDELSKEVKFMFRDESIVMDLKATEKEGISIPTEEDLEGIYLTLKNSQLEDYKDVETSTSLMEDLPKQGSIVDEKEYDDLDITEYKLSNGAKVILKQTDFSANQIMMRAYSKGGFDLASDDNYISANVATDIVNSGGIADFDPNTLNKMLTGTRVNVSPYLNRLTEGFNGSSTPQDLEIMFQLIHLYFTSPRKDKEAYTAVYNQYLEFIKNAQSNPNYIFSDTSNQVLYDYHPRNIIWTPDKLKKIDLDKSFDFYKDRFKDASDFTFIFVGNFEFSKINKFITTYLASLPSINRDETFKDRDFDITEKSFTKIVKAGIEEKADVRYVINGKYDYDEQKNLQFKTMIRILNILLTEELREKKAGIYSAYAAERTHKLPKESYEINIGYTCAPSRVEEMKEELMKILNRLKSEEMDETYMKRAKEVMKSNFKKSMQTNRFWSSIIYSFDFNHRDLNYLLKYQTEIDKVSSSDVQNAAESFLNFDTMKELLLLPSDEVKSVR